MSNLQVTGLLYPAKEDADAGKKNDRTFHQLVNEYRVEEIDELVSALPGVPLVLKHNRNLVVGHVVSAVRTLADGVLITVFIDGSSKLGAETVSKVNNGYYRALSLGHFWEYDKISGEAFKIPEEVTICRIPRRKSCMLQGKTEAGYGSDEIEGDINTGVLMHEKCGGTIDCEFSIVKMESDNAPSAMDADVAPPTEPMATEPAPEPAPALDQADILKTLEESSLALSQRDQALEEALARSAQLQSMIEERDKIAAEKEEQQKKEMEAVLQKQKDLEAEKKRSEQHQAKVTQERINALQADLAARLLKSKLPAPPTSATKVDQLQYTEAVLAAAIKEDELNKRDRKNMEHQSRQLQQENNAIGSTLDQFGRPPATLRGTMKASRDDEEEDVPQVKRVNRETLLQVYQKNVGKMSMGQLQDIAARIASESETSGIYTASADDMQVDRSGPKPIIDGFALYPAMYEKISKGCTGLGYEAEQVQKWKENMYYATPGYGSYHDDLRAWRSNNAR